MNDTLRADAIAVSNAAHKNVVGNEVCLLCGSRGVTRIWSIAIDRGTVRDYLAAWGVRDDTLHLLRCDDCHCVYQWPTLPRPVYLEWYADQHYDFCRGNGYGSPELEATRHAAKVLHTLETLTEDRRTRLLDVGCGTGVFLDACAEAGWIVAGCDPSAHRIFRHQMPVSYPLTVRPFEDAEFGPSQFDIITFWDVFEHFLDPREVLEKVRGLLTDDGLVAIEVPNVRSLYSRLLKSHWWYDFEHVFYYSPGGLLQLLSQLGFSPVCIESDNFNLLTCEGVARLGLLGRDAVWGRIDNDSSPRISTTVRRVIQQKGSSLAGIMLGQLMRAPNAILNRVVNGLLLGDQLRVFAKKGALPSGECRAAISEPSFGEPVARRRRD